MLRIVTRNIIIIYLVLEFIEMPTKSVLFLNNWYQVIKLVFS